MTDDRNSRNIALFGADGQSKIGTTRVGIVGLGGLGMPVAQQLAYLGVLDYRLVDADVVTDSSLNRLVGATPGDVNVKKVAIAQRMITAIQPAAAVKPFDAWLADATGALDGTDVVFGCLDKDIHRVALVRQCTAAGVPFFDLATDTDDRHGSLAYGGRVLFSGHGERCPFCMDLLDQESMRRDSLPPDARASYDRIYGVDKLDLEAAGPSVVSLNSLVASLAVTEFMVWVTRLREPRPLLVYRAERGVITMSMDAPTEGCPYCSVARRAAA